MWFDRLPDFFMHDMRERFVRALDANGWDAFKNDDVGALRSMFVKIFPSVGSYPKFTALLSDLRRLVRIYSLECTPGVTRMDYMLTAQKEVELQYFRFFTQNDLWSQVHSGWRDFDFDLDTRVDRYEFIMDKLEAYTDEFFPVELPTWLPDLSEMESVFAHIITRKSLWVKMKDFPMGGRWDAFARDHGVDSLGVHDLLDGGMSREDYEKCMNMLRSYVRSTIPVEIPWLTATGLELVLAKALFLGDWKFNVCPEHHAFTGYAGTYEEYASAMDALRKKYDEHGPKDMSTLIITGVNLEEEERQIWTNRRNKRKKNWCGLIKRLRRTKKTIPEAISFLNNGPFDIVAKPNGSGITIYGTCCNFLVKPGTPCQKCLIRNKKKCDRCGKMTDKRVASLNKGLCEQCVLDVPKLCGRCNKVVLPEHECVEGVVTEIDLMAKLEPLKKVGNEYVCVYCNTTMARRAYSQHKKRKHADLMGIAPIACPFGCGYVNTCQSQINVHVRGSHVKDALIPCRAGCGQMFKYSAVETVHYNKFHKLKP